MRRPLLAATLAAAIDLSAPAWAEAGHWQGQAESINKAVSTAEATYAAGDVDGGKRAVQEAYFHNFEDSKMESAIRKHVSAKRAAEIEKHFSTLRKAMAAKDSAQVAAVSQTLREAIASEAKTLDDAKVSPQVFEVNQ
ncbi:MAG TPA: hypothetical protein VL974_15835 [Magnetospirillum sp.]|jgi:high-affinity iron transporter|nr:hypothetical protein [Magnetospirillum sp.]